MREKREPRPILPVSLLVEGRPCLVVGGGRIAARKVGHLLAAAAEVTVVSPEACEDLRDLAADGRVRHLAREFEAADASDQCLVFACTDCEATNRLVLECGRERGALCSAIDSNWPGGDFVMPAICRKHGLTVSVATGGKSCTQAKQVKEQIAEMLENYDE